MTTSERPPDPVETTVETTVELAHPVERVWRAVTEPDELVRWLATTSATLDPRVGGTGVLVWDMVGDDGASQHRETGVRVHEVEVPHRLVWSWGHPPTSGTDPVTAVELLLAPREDGGTTLVVRESGFLDAAHRAASLRGWDGEVAELLAYLGRDAG